MKVSRVGLLLAVVTTTTIADPRYRPIRPLPGGFVRNVTLAVDMLANTSSATASASATAYVVLKETWANTIENFGPAGPAFATSSNYQRAHSHHHNLNDLAVVRSLQQLGLADAATAAAAGLMTPLSIEQDEQGGGHLLMVFDAYDGTTDFYQLDAPQPLLAHDRCAAATAMATVMKALAVMHKGGLAHHDVHARNVLFRRRWRVANGTSPMNGTMARAHQQRNTTNGAPTQPSEVRTRVQRHTSIILLCTTQQS